MSFIYSRDFGSYEDYQDACFEEDMDRLADARAEAYDEEHPPNMECGECGYEWYSPILYDGYLDPPEPKYPDCPRCEGLVPQEDQ